MRVTLWDMALRRRTHDDMSKALVMGLRARSTWSRMSGAIGDSSVAWHGWPLQEHTLMAPGVKHE